MNDNVSYLSGGQMPDVHAMSTAVHAFLDAFQKQKLAFQPTLHDGVERHARLLDENQRKLKLGLQALLAQLSEAPLRFILDELETGDDGDLFSLAQELRDDVLKPLTQVITLLKADRDGFSALPALDASRERSRLEKTEKILREATGHLSQLLEDEQTKRAALSAAIEALEAKEVNLDLSGLVPTSDQLSALAVPGAEAKLALDAAIQAMKDLEKIMGSIIEGIRYSELQDCRREVTRRVADLEREISDKTRQIKEVEHQQKMLDVVPELLGYAAGWLSSVQAIIRSMEALFIKLKGSSASNVQGVKDLDAVFAEILNYGKGLLSLMNTA